MAGHWQALLLLTLCLVSVNTGGAGGAGEEPAVQPVIIDTDIGSYPDDTFAIALALQSKDYLDVKMFVTSTDDTRMRARILAKTLTIAGYDHIPIGIGAPNDNVTNHTLWEWAQDYNLADYKGGVYEFDKAVEKMTEIVTNSPTVVDIITLTPLDNMPHILAKSPHIGNNSRIKAMGGSIYRGYDNSTTPCAEYNVRLCPECFNVLLRAHWAEPVTLTPLDTSGVAWLTPENVDALIICSTVWSDILEQHLLFWCTKGVIPCELENETVALPDLVAVLLSLSKVTSFIDFEDRPLLATDNGYTQINSTGGVSTKVALNWKGMTVGLKEFREYLITVLCKS